MHSYATPNNTKNSCQPEGDLPGPTYPKISLVSMGVSIFKVVPGGCDRYFFGVKVKTVKLIGGTRFLAARSGLNVRT